MGLRRQNWGSPWLTSVSSLNVGPRPHTLRSDTGREQTNISGVTTGRFGDALGGLCEHEQAGNREEDRKAASEPPVGKAMEDLQPKPRSDQRSR